MIVAARSGRVVCVQRGGAGGLEQPQQQRDREGGRRKGDDDSGDDQRLRNRIAAEARCRPLRATTPKRQKHTAAEQVEGEDLAERLGIRRSRRRGRAPPPRRAHSPNTVAVLIARRSVRADRPAAAPSVTAIVSVMRDLDAQDQRLGVGHRIGKERVAQPESAEADDQEDRGAGNQQQPQPSAAHRRRIGRVPPS